MHDPKFEKEVQQKLQELTFSPSEAVWTNVEWAVNGKKRRRVPIFWLFLLPTLTLTGAGMVYFSTRTGTTHKKIVHVSTVKAPAAKVPTVEVPDAKVSTVKVSDEEVSSGKVPAIEAPAIESLRGKESSPGKQGLSQTEGSRGKEGLSEREDLKRKESLSRTEGLQGKEGSTEGLQGTKNLPGKESLSRTKGLPGTKDVNAAAGRTTVAANTVSAVEAERANLPALNVFDHQFSIRAARLSSRSQAAAATKAPIQLKPKYTWEAGFAGGIGVSSLNNTLFQQPSTVASDVRNANSSTAVTGNPKSYTSRIQPGLSYWAGIVGQRPLNERLTLSLGLSLHYYSTKIQIGEKVTSPAPSYYYSQSLFTMAAAPSTTIYPYYSVGDKNTYTNHYYFVELPASVIWKVNHSRNLPLFWEGGFSLSYLVSSNALYYDHKAAVFYKDGGITNKTQFNLSTAFLVGLPVKGMRLQAGPQIQYGITGLQNSGSTAGQHLFYGGLRVILLPGKANK